MDRDVASEAARAVLAALVGTPGRLFDPRDPGVVTLLRHATLSHCLELTVRVVPDDADLRATLGRPTILYDERDRGALENFAFVSRRDDDGFAHLRLRHIVSGREVELALRVEPTASTA